MIKLRRGTIIEQTATQERGSYQVVLNKVETDQEWGWFKLVTTVNQGKEIVPKVDFPTGCKYIAILMPNGSTRGMSIEGEYFNTEQLSHDLEMFYQRAGVEIVSETP